MGALYCFRFCYTCLHLQKRMGTRYMYMGTSTNPIHTRLALYGTWYPGTVGRRMYSCNPYRYPVILTIRKVPGCHGRLESWLVAWSVVGRRSSVVGTSTGTGKYITGLYLYIHTVYTTIYRQYLLLYTNEQVAVYGMKYSSVASCQVRVPVPGTRVRTAHRRRSTT